MVLQLLVSHFMVLMHWHHPCRHLAVLNFHSLQLCLFPWSAPPLGASPPMSLLPEAGLPMSFAPIAADNKSGIFANLVSRPEQAMAPTSSVSLSHFGPGSNARNHGICQAHEYHHHHLDCSRCSRQVQKQMLRSLEADKLRQLGAVEIAEEIEVKPWRQPSCVNLRRSILLLRLQFLWMRS